MDEQYMQSHGSMPAQDRNSTIVGFFYEISSSQSLPSWITELVGLIAVTLMLVLCYIRYRCHKGRCCNNRNREPETLETRREAFLAGLDLPPSYNSVAGQTGGGIDNVNYVPDDPDGMEPPPPYQPPSGDIAVLIAEGVLPASVSTATAPPPYVSRISSASTEASSTNLSSMSSSQTSSSETTTTITTTTATVTTITIPPGMPPVLTRALRMSSTDQEQSASRTTPSIIPPAAQPPIAQAPPPPSPATTSSQQKQSLPTTPTEISLNFQSMTPVTSSTTITPSEQEPSSAALPPPSPAATPSPQPAQPLPPLPKELSRASAPLNSSTSTRTSTSQDPPPGSPPPSPSHAASPSSQQLA